MKLRTFALVIASMMSSPYVERESEGAAPKAFRIWAAGKNDSDDGPTFFTKKSAELLMAEQEARGREYPSDFDHLSLIPNRPAESGRASGYHRLEVREGPDGPELWAVDIEWCADVKAGLEEQPPRWKYFSPAFKQSEDGEVTSYVNFALCINPKTHKLPSLAALGGCGDTPMNKKAMKALLAKMAEAATDEEQKQALAAIAAALGDDDEPAAKAEGDGDKKDPPAPPAAADDKTDAKATKAEGEPPPAKKEEDKTNSIGGELASELAKANAKIAALEVKGMLDARPDLSESIKKWCMTQDADTVRSYLAAHPKGSAPRKETTTTPPAGGAGQGLEGDELAKMSLEMGIGAGIPKGPTVDEQGRFTLHTVRPSDMSKVKLLSFGKVA